MLGVRIFFTVLIVAAVVLISLVHWKALSPDLRGREFQRLLKQPVEFGILLMLSVITWCVQVGFIALIFWTWS